ncbi:MAG: hypothetical protein HYY93_01500 [Planctomycetes bacterium]|nr:hypothetical protein [Planctomycetota bacterium]
MKKIAVVPTLLLSFLSFGLRADDVDTKASGPDTSAAKELEEQGFRKFKDPCLSYSVDELRDEINLLNLLNGLYLTDEQMLGVMLDADRANRARAGYHAQVDRLNREMEEHLAAMREILVKSGYAASAFESQSYRSHQRRYEDAQEEVQEIARKARGEIAELEGHLGTIVTENQKAIVDGYTSCLIPNKDMKDPTRIGQANENKGRELEGLEKLRGASAAELSQVFDAYFQETLDYLEHHHCVLTDKAQEKERARLLAVVEKARKMGDLDYALSKDALADEMHQMPDTSKDDDTKSDKQKARDAARADKQKRAEENSAKGKPKGPQVTKLGHFLLHPRMAPILARRLKASKTFQAAEQIDLDQIEAAATCEGGHCGLKD